MVSSMLHETVRVSGWQAEWLDRTMPAFRYYQSFTTNLSLLAICILGLASYFGIRRCTKRIIAGTERREIVLKEVEHRVLKNCRAQWYVGLFLLLNTVAVGIVDGGISFATMSKDIATQPEKYDARYIAELVLFIICIATAFTATLVLVPLAQVKLATSLLARRMRKIGDTSLAAYMPEARIYSTHAAQIWAMVSFMVMVSWPPIAGGFWRWILLEATIGSALTWLDVGFVLNFSYEYITDTDFHAGTRGVKEFVRMFVDAHSHTTEKDILPRYVAIAAPTNDFIAEEKTPLTDTVTR
ncbi:hypothetical protein LTR10_005155 [Elasticomyces elasticus]|nr:hypothetical protein LTR10_005155 [Elasticomyces elasticus]KAK4975895.1 hypothetical protein LTR42_003516 [Elasticomyces elasticus]